MPIRLSGMASGLDTDAIIKDLMSAQTLKKTNIEGNKKKLEWKKEKWEEMNTKLYALYTEKLTPLKLQGGYLLKKADSSNADKASAEATTAANGSYSLKINKLAKAQYVTGARISGDQELKKTSKISDTGLAVGQTITIKYGKDLSSTKEITIEEDTTIESFVAELNKADLTASFDETSRRFAISSKNSGVDSAFTISSTISDSTGLKALGLDTIDAELAKTGRNASDTSTMAVVAASDSEVVLNGAYITSSNNKITQNGLTIDLKGTTVAGEEINITVGNDTDAVYTKIKEFVTSYNELMTEMYKKYSAASAKGYDMLTDEQREAMSDEEEELWDNKIKDSLLRRDDTLNTLMSSFRTAMQKTVEVDGKSYSMASYGIVTGVYTEHGLLHINGDTDDKLYADKEDGLKKALNEDPETVSKVFSEIMSGFYNDMSKQMSATSISSALTFYNDKQIQSQVDEYQKQIDDWAVRLEDMEDRYYKQFSTMEQSLTSLQQQQSQLAGLLGTGA